MATYTVQAPDGHQIEIQGPDGASHDQVIAMAQQLYQPGSKPQGDGAIAGEPDLGSAGNSLLAGGIHFVHQLPLVGDAAITAGHWANDQLNGRPSSWAQANSEAHQTINSAQQQHPVASTVGGIAGGADAALIGGEALKGAGLAPQALALRAGQPVANAARMVASGALAGGVQGGAQAGGEQLAGGNVGAALPAAIGGAATGAVTGGVLGGVLGGAGGAADALRASVLPGKTALALSKVFGESASDLQAAWQQFSQATGRAPTMAELATLKQRGAIANAAKGSGAITEALSQRADDVAHLRSMNMQAGFGLGSGSSGELGNVRTAQGDIDYTASRAAPDFNIPTEESADLGGVSPADHIAAEILPAAGLGKADRVRIMNGLQDGTLSSQDAQMIRSGLSDSLNRNFSPATKGFLSDLDSLLHGPGNEEAAGALDRATSNFAANSRRMEGAAHGEGILGPGSAANFGAEAASNANPEFVQGLQLGANSRLASAAATPQGALGLAQRLATDDELHQKLSTAIGPDAADAARELGAAEANADLNLAPFKNRAPGPADDDTANAAKRVVQGVLAGVSHGAFAVYHAAKAIAGWDSLPPGVGEKVAQYLADPKMVGQGINLLRRAGATNEQLRQFALHAAQIGGGVAGGSINGGQEH